ncbi:unnamed protein product [Rhizoctonia solani]|uniref:Uncharacterized protein n=1 Tax=Rhizoctonia solani TaxID=456999 RepID=A0A8H3B1A1_9AGAM|nr:unnamed protein product [Rhizoctonia solani]
MFRLAHAVVALLAASPLLAARLRDGQYKISYSPAPCGLETRHYLELTGPTNNATFNPISESQAQTWTVVTSATDSTWREIQSVKYPGISLGYPSAKREIRVRGIDENSEDFYYFNMVDVAKEGYYYVYPYTSRDMVINGDTRMDPQLRWAYFRGNSTQFPLPMLPLLFTPATNVAVGVNA